MFDKDALAYLDAHMNGHEDIATDDSPSQLLALPRDSQIVSLENFQKAPNRIMKNQTLLSCASFCEYVQRFKGDETSVYLDVDDGKFKAVIDHHGKDAPSWGSHTAHFAPKRSLEWVGWSGVHRKKLTQVELAHFIEEMMDSMIEPTPNVMLKAALDFQSNEKLTLGSTTNLDDGSVRFNFTKDNVTTNVVFPHRIKIGIPLFENEQPVELEARVRYRTTGEGQLTFTISFVKDPRAIRRDAMLDIAENIKAGITLCKHYEGAL